MVKSGEAEIGEMDYCLDFYSHRNVGPSEKTVLCLKGTYGKPCPICEHSASLRKAGKEKEANSLKSSRRVVYNVQDLKEPEKLKVFETSHYLFEKELIEEARDDEEGGFIDFADIDEGKEIKFRASKSKIGDKEFMEYKSFSFEDRDEPLDEDLLASAISFDELLTVPTYEEVEKILYGDDDEDEGDEDEEKPSKKSKSEPEDEDNEDDEPKKSGKPKFEPVKKSKSYDEDEDEDDDDEPEEDDDEKPAKKSSKKSEEDDDDEDDEPEEKPAKKSCSGKCPFNHKYGDDCDEFSDCDDCEVWDKCVKLKKE